MGNIIHHDMQFAILEVGVVYAYGSVSKLDTLLTHSANTFKINDSHKTALQRVPNLSKRAIPKKKKA